MTVRKYPWAAALGALALSTASTALAQDTAAAVERARQIEAQAAQNPSPALLWFLAEARLAAQDKAGAAEALERLADRKAGFAPPRRSVFDGHADDETLGPVIARLRREAAKPGGEVVATVDWLVSCPKASRAMRRPDGS